MWFVNQPKFQFEIEQAGLCLNFKLKKMKRIFILAFFIASNLAFVSCTNDDVEDTIKNNKSVVTNASMGETGGGANGQTPIPPPK
ncbi:hypothetical protein EAG11_12890 [Flavobacterium sp. 140616W15]|nr:hypothetical protein EAG11_12890 [Flavobacterium sp. 140616W15]